MVLTPADHGSIDWGHILQFLDKGLRRYFVLWSAVDDATRYAYGSYRSARQAFLQCRKANADSGARGIVSTAKCYVQSAAGWFRVNLENGTPH